MFSLFQIAIDALRVRLDIRRDILNGCRHDQEELWAWPLTNNKQQSRGNARATTATCVGSIENGKGLTWCHGATPKGGCGSGLPLSSLALLVLPIEHLACESNLLLSRISGAHMIHPYRRTCGVSRCRRCDDAE